MFTYSIAAMMLVVAILIFGVVLKSVLLLQALYKKLVVAAGQRRYRRLREMRIVVIQRSNTPYPVDRQDGNSYDWFRSDYAIVRISKKSCLPDTRAHQVAEAINRTIQRELRDRSLRAQVRPAIQTILHDWDHMWDWGSDKIGPTEVAWLKDASNREDG